MASPEHLPEQIAQMIFAPSQQDGGFSLSAPPAGDQQSPGCPDTRCPLGHGRAQVWLLSSICIENLNFEMQKVPSCVGRHCSREFIAKPKYLCRNFVFSLCP